ncbi:MAG: hypothetical protein ABIW79_06935 [Gemmatimonas sp.]
MFNVRNLTWPIAPIIARWRTIALVMTACLGCDANPYDARQRPQVSVLPVTVDNVTISWQPDGAQMVRVYRGPAAGDGYGDQLLWSIVANAKNGLRSGLRYGAASDGAAVDVPARPLSAGALYTVEVTRADPRGRGDGFTNTANRYVGTSTFVAAAAAP